MKALFALLVFAAAQQAWADDITLNLTAQTQSVYEGGTAVFSGYVSNNDNGIVDLNSISITFPGEGVTNPLDFFYGPPAVEPLGTTQLFDLFTITIAYPYTDMFGLISGSITLVGGLETNGYDPTTQNVLTTQIFSVDVVKAPEPRTFVLLLAVLPVLLIPGFRKRLNHAQARPKHNPEVAGPGTGRTRALSHKPGTVVARPPAN